MLLAIDTSTALTGLACYDASGLLAECVWESGRNHTAQVLPQCAMLLHHLQRTPADVQAVAVALGPGSWSGLRVGVSLAQGMALAGNLALIGITTLDALAYQHQRPRVTVYPLIRLGRERFATATYQSGKTWRRTSDYQNVTLADLSATITDTTLFCGDIDSEVTEHLQQALGQRAHFPSAAANLRRPGFLAELAWQRWQAGDLDAPGQLEPLYLGEPVKPKPAGGAATGSAQRTAQN
ncbi:MAG: tRNA (adenosine(37)-N6)-threonylcarbamoyltransferase complex dimerization subunit type 1 TsaB [Chloroflexaceae bacterium]|nr:tRNA (adenosine(37)-N6)-threonylcarbamoyltransferase complex dimerization subunit type 1 TsaB [Chloroflexaceae bacterium]